MLAIGRDLRHVRLEREHRGNAIEARHRQLERRPHGRQLPQRHVEAVHVEQESDQETDAECAGGDHVEAVDEHHQLGHVQGQAVERDEERVRDAGGDRRRIVALVGGAEMFPQVVDSVERDNHPEVAHALLNVAAQAAERLQARGVLPLHPSTGGAC